VYPLGWSKKESSFNRVKCPHRGGDDSLLPTYCRISPFVRLPDVVPVHEDHTTNGSNLGLRMLFYTKRLRISICSLTGIFSSVSENPPEGWIHVCKS
jgi:hypothetical protein